MKLGSRLEAAVPKDKIGDVKVMNNEYDNEKFFEEYAKMSRSKEGLKAAGEWHQLKPLFPSLEGKSVLDLGCGYGWHCKFAEEQGATKILGIDLSKKMIEEAQKRNSGNQIEYRISGLEEYDYPENEWDCVISNLALHYIEDIVEIFQKVYRTLKPGGIFLFNIEHPVFTAGVGQDWIYIEHRRRDRSPLAPCAASLDAAHFLCTFHPVSGSGFSPQASRKGYTLVTFLPVRLFSIS